MGPIPEISQRMVRASTSRVKAKEHVALAPRVLDSPAHMRSDSPPVGRTQTQER